jgi:predicted ThiF/HesA family dinucleotide-utilizing enzyme
MKKIVIVGVGALGSHVVLLSRNLEVAIRAIDFDRVEQKNVQSQFQGRPGIGKLKVAALDQLMRFLFGAGFETNSNKLAPDNVAQLLGGADLVVDCVDNGETRRLVQTFVRERKIACVHGALAPDGQFGRVVWDESFVVDDASGDGATCEDGEHLPFIAISAAYLAHAVKEFVLRGAKVGFSISPAGAVRI